MSSQLTSNASSQQITVFPPDRSIGALAVDPPYPVGFKPQEDGALGVNIHMVRGDRDGLLVYLLAYFEMAIGDSIKVFIENTRAPVAQFSVTAAHFDDLGNAKNIPFHISAADMESRYLPLQIQNKDFWFEVTRISGNAESSTPLPLLYKYPAPGEADTDGGKPFNQGLKLPVASEGFVDQTVIDDGMFVTVLQYFNQHIGDVVVLAFGSLLLETTVTALGDVMFELTPDQLATLAPTNTLMVRWEVFDVVENASGWSDSLVLPFKPGIVLLAAPIFEQADIDNVLHHDQLAGGTAGILVTGVFAANDRIELTLQGVTQGGEAVTHTYNRTLSTATRTVDFPVENETIRNLIGGALHASYQLIRAGKSQLSKPADVTVSGLSQPLGLPLVAPLVDGKLPVDTAEATVQLAEYWPLQTGATVEARWQTTDKDGVAALYIFRLIVSDPTQPVIFKVPAKYIAPFPDTPLVVQCTVTNPGQTQVFSELLQLRISEQAVVQLDPPTLVKPALTPIDALAFPDGVTMRIEYLSALTGDRARLVHVKGTQTFPLMAFNSNKRVNTVLSQAFLAAWQGQTLQFLWNLNRNNAQAGKSGPVTVSVLKIADGDTRLPPPLITQATGPQGAQIVDLTTFTGNATATVAPWPGIAAGQRVWLQATGTLENGTPLTLTLLDGVAITTAHTTRGLNEPVLRTELEKLKNDTPLRLELKVTFDGTADKTAAVTFPVSTYTLKTFLLMAPTLTNVTDNNGTEVPEGGSTLSTTLHLKGQASKGKQVEIFDGIGADATSKGKATADITTGDWQLTITVPLGARSLYAKSLYHPDDTFSNVRTLTVNTRATITSVRDAANVALPNPGSTYQTGVTLTGTAGPNQQVQILLNGGVRDTVTTDSKGDWTFSISGLAVGSQQFVARPLPTGEDSTPWVVQVLRQKLSITWDFSNSLQGWVPSGRYVGTFYFTNGMTFTYTDAPGGFSGAVMSINVTVNAGSTYDLGFTATDVSVGGRFGTYLSLLANGARTGTAVNLYQYYVWHTFSGVYTAPDSGTITLMIWNDTDAGDGNDFGLRNIWIRER